VKGDYLTAPRSVDQGSDEPISAGDSFAFEALTLAYRAAGHQGGVAVNPHDDVNVESVGGALCGLHRCDAFRESVRRVAENATNGTDHGTAAAVFMIGGAIRRDLVGTPPSLTDLEDGDLKTHIDFRRDYAAALDDWLGLPSRETPGGTFEPLLLFQG
jgi:hypothetical protein